MMKDPFYMFLAFLVLVNALTFVGFGIYYLKFLNRNIDKGITSLKDVTEAIKRKE